MLEEGIMRKEFCRALIVAAPFVFAVAPLQMVSAQTIELDDFESGSIRIINPGESSPSVKFLWNQYEGDFYAGPDPGIESITTSQAYHGTHSLKIDVTSGNVYLQFYPATSFWNFMHSYVQPSSGWTANTYNAMRFWVKVPPQIRKASGGKENIQLGTYVRSKNGDRNSQGSHYYHFYNFEHTGEWEQVIFDSHPTYLIGAGGNTEVGNVEQVGSGWNYMDGLTRFYFDGQGSLSGQATFYFDKFELFTRPANENIEQVYSLHGVYVPGSNRVQVGWARRKNQDTLAYEVRYAFEDIHALGWDNATPAPGGSISGNGNGAYNLMEYSTTGISVSGKSMVYVAIKPKDSSLFRQIALPTTSQAPIAPEPPGDVQVD